MCYHLFLFVIICLLLLVFACYCILVITCYLLLQYYEMTNFVVPFIICFWEHHPTTTKARNRLNDPDISSLLLLGQRLFLCLTRDLVRRRRSFVTAVMVRSIVRTDPSFASSKLVNAGEFY